MFAELKTFIAVVQYGTFSAAADRVGLTQGAVSGHIRRLEDYLGFPLFDRSGQAAKLNHDGHRTLQRARTIVQLLEALGSPEEEGTGRELRIGAIESVRASVLEPALALFHLRHPEQRIDIVPAVSLHLLDQFDADEVDMALLIRPPFNLSVEADWTTIMRDTYFLLVPADCGESDWRIALQTRPMLAYDRLSFTGRQVDRFIRGLPFRIIEGPEISVNKMVDEVAKGLGLALVPLSNRVLPLPAGVRALPLHTKGFFREIGILTSRQRAQEPRVDFLKTCFADVAEQFAGEARKFLATEHNSAS